MLGDQMLDGRKPPQHDLVFQMKNLATSIL